MVGWAFFRAWVRESLAARLLAIAAALAVLNVIGSALADRGPAPDEPAPPVSPAASSVPALAPPASEPDAGLAPAPPPAPAPTAAGTTSTDGPVDLNSATVDDLKRLPGVGPKRAEAILAVRARLGGRFRQIEDLLKVKGIGRATLKRLRPLVRLDSTASGAH
jgi:competence protein ComEA